MELCVYQCVVNDVCGKAARSVQRVFIICSVSMYVCLFAVAARLGKLFQLCWMIQCNTMNGNHWQLSIFLLSDVTVCTLTAVNRLAYPKCRLDSVICKCNSYSCLSHLLTASEPALDEVHLIFAETVGLSAVQ